MELTSSEYPEKTGSDGPDQSHDPSAEIGDALSPSDKQEGASIDTIVDAVDQLYAQAGELNGYTQEACRKELIDKIKAGVLGPEFQKSLLRKIRAVVKELLNLARQAGMITGKPYMEAVANIYGKTVTFSRVGGTTKQSPNINNERLLELIQKTDRTAVLEELLRLSLKRQQKD